MENKVLSDINQKGKQGELTILFKQSRTVVNLSTKTFKSEDRQREILAFKKRETSAGGNVSLAGDPGDQRLTFLVKYHRLKPPADQNNEYRSVTEKMRGVSMTSDPRLSADLLGISKIKRLAFQLLCILAANVSTRPPPLHPFKIKTSMQINTKIAGSSSCGGIPVHCIYYMFLIKGTRLIN